MLEHDQCAVVAAASTNELVDTCPAVPTHANDPSMTEESFMLHLKRTAFAGLLAALLLLSPLAASAMAAGGTLKGRSATVQNSERPRETLVPEPGAALVFGVGVLVVGAALHRRSRR
jgi:hypothetical protein